jgi:two-component system cell cycle response regulator
MAEKNLQIAILNQARAALDQEDLTQSEKDGLLKLLDILILSLDKYAPPENLAGESRILAEKLVSSQALLTLAAQQADELDALKILSLNLTASLDLPTVLDAVVKEAMRLMDKARIVHIFLYTNNKLEFGASLDSDGQKNRVLSEPRKDGLTETVASKGRMIIVEDMKNHSIYKNAPADWSGSIIGIPLKMGEKVVGVMNLSRHNTGSFSAAELRLLNMLANQAAVAISNASLHKSVSQKAYTDTTTGLANRRALDEHLESEIINARRTNSSFAVMMMDLDGFKSVNDTYGHEVGDQVLRAVFSVVAFGIRSSDFIARYGGDELTLILAKSNLLAAKLVAEKIMENLANFSYKAPDGKAIKLGISGGIAIYPDHGRAGAELLRAADAALYYAKKHNRGKFLTAKPMTGPLNKLNLNTPSSEKNGGS